jgi:hypothetical protein
MRYLCEDTKRTFRILRTLPFFTALCDAETLSGVVLFNPSLESTSLLKAWLVYRDPALQLWVLEASRPHIIRAVVRNMIIYGPSPALGLFVEFDPNYTSISFLASWLTWYGIIPSPDMDLAARSEIWWRRVATERRTEMANSAHLLQLKADSQLASIRGGYKSLLVSLSVAHIQRDNLIASFESLDKGAINRLSPKDFNILLTTLASLRIPDLQSEALSSDTEEERQKSSLMMQLFRQTRAIANNTGSDTTTYKNYVTIKKDNMKHKQARLRADPESSKAINSSFWMKHGIDMALRTKKSIVPMISIMMWSSVIQIGGQYLEAGMTWKRAPLVVRSAINIVTSIAKKDPKMATQAAAELMAAYRYRDGRAPPNEQILVDGILRGFMRSFLSNK